MPSQWNEWAGHAGSEAVWVVICCTSLGLCFLICKKWDWQYLHCGLLQWATYCNTWNTCRKHLEWGMKSVCSLLQVLPHGCGCRSSLLWSTVRSCPDPISRGWIAGDNACWRWRRSPGETPPLLQQLTPILNQASNPSIVAITGQHHGRSHCA